MNQYFRNKWSRLKNATKIELYIFLLIMPSILSSATLMSLPMPFMEQRLVRGEIYKYKAGYKRPAGYQIKYANEIYVISSWDCGFSDFNSWDPNGEIGRATAYGKKIVNLVLDNGSVICDEKKVIKTKVLRVVRSIFQWYALGFLVLFFRRS